MRFEWNEAKNRSNLRKHRVSFEAASEVFQDANAVTIQDREEGDEQRWHLIGLLRGRVILTVAHAIRIREGEETVRIISARRATKAEKELYEEGQN